jgi:hypothetical protein
MPVSYSSISELIKSKITEQTQFKRISNSFGSFESLMFTDVGRAMLGTLAGKDGNFMCAGKGVVTLFLALVDESISLETLVEKKDFKGINIAEWVYVGKRTNLQAAAYLNVFGKYGLKENGMLLWLSYNGGVGGYFIINADKSIYLSSNPVSGQKPN